jgi:hypothetical protein
VRLDVKMERLVERLARKRGGGKSEVVREALALLAEREEEPPAEGSPFETVADLVGCARGGPRDLSVRTGEKVRALLEAKRSAGRRPGSRANAGR